MPCPKVIQRAFLTGATGFVGANLARALLENGIQVTALVRRGSDRSSLQGLEVDCSEGELLDEKALDAALRGCDACFHLAAAISAVEEAELFRINVEGTRTVLAAAVRAGCGSIVHTSTVGTLWREDGAPARETDHGLAPGASAYVKTKLEAEESARKLARAGAPVVIVHPSAPVGGWDRVPTVSGRRIVDVLRGKVPRWIPGAINHVYVGDVATGMLLAARHGKPGQSYLLANRAGNLTRDQFVELVSQAGKLGPVKTRRSRLLSWLTRKHPATPSPGNGPVSLACDPTWTIAELGLPQTPLERAFQEAVDWFRKR